MLFTERSSNLTVFFSNSRHKNTATDRFRCDHKECVDAISSFFSLACNRQITNNRSRQNEGGSIDFLNRAQERLENKNHKFYFVFRSNITSTDRRAT